MNLELLVKRVISEKIIVKNISDIFLEEGMDMPKELDFYSRKTGI